MKNLNDRVTDMSTTLHKDARGADDVQGLVSSSIASQLGAVTSRLRADIDKSVGVAMQTMQVRVWSMCAPSRVDRVVTPWRATYSRRECRTLVLSVLVSICISPAVAGSSLSYGVCVCVCVCVCVRVRVRVRAWWVFICCR